MVHNFCVCFKLNDGSVKTIIHQKTEEYEESSDAKQLAQRFKQEVSEVHYKHTQDTQRLASAISIPSFPSFIAPKVCQSCAPSNPFTLSLEANDFHDSMILIIVFIIVSLQNNTIYKQHHKVRRHQKTSYKLLSFRAFWQRFCFKTK